MVRPLESFNLSCRYQRYLARRAGYDVPKQPPGKKPKDFDSLISKRGVGECWDWKGHLTVDGYGLYSEGGRTWRAHRVALMRDGARIPEGMVVMHSCDNRKCCNPAHLCVGTSPENTADKVLKNRQAKGESQGGSVLTEAQVREIRSRYAFRKTTYKMLAEEFGVCKDTIQKAVRGIYWRHV